jgi:hypothetical protein
MFIPFHDISGSQCISQKKIYFKCGILASCAFDCDAVVFGFVKDADFVEAEVFASSTE